jgi:outer membrane protein OmpA-like peptidoglycan-associated protein
MGRWVVRTFTADKPGVRSERVVITAVAVALFVSGGTWWAVGRVERDLASRSKAALAAAGIIANARYEGADAVLTGTVPEAGQAAEAIGIVAQIPGTRHVTSRLIVASGLRSEITPGTGMSFSPAPSADFSKPGNDFSKPGKTVAPPHVDIIRLPRGTITFGSNDAVLSAQAKAYLDRVAAILLRHPQIRITVRGHSDNLGPDEVNWALSKRRATAAMGYLIHRQVTADRFKLQSFAATSPVAPNDTLEGRTANRRVELAIEEVP